MEKLSHEQRVHVARCIGVAKAFMDAGYSYESTKLAMDSSLPEGIEKEAFWGAIARGIGGLGKWFIRGAKASRAARMGSKAIKPGKSSFSTLENLRRNIGMDLTRWSKKPGKAAWETGKGIVGNMIFPGMIKSKSTIGKGVGTGIFAKSMLGGMGGGSAPPQQPGGYGY
jgi:hypothetical protein